MAWLVGWPRKKISWHPTVDPEKSVKCGMCMNYGINVYDWTEEGPAMARSNQCVVGCSTCANLCMGDAISFQDIQNVRDIYRREKIWAKVKRQLEEEGKMATGKKTKERGGCGCQSGVDNDSKIGLIDRISEKPAPRFLLRGRKIGVKEGGATKAIEVRNLTKRFGGFTAVDYISFEVEVG